ncbi:MAG: DUF456 family protein [Planctomycetota bacterium]|nr:DUF456 family protein [Planctomycetota bacterium]
MNPATTYIIAATIVTLSSLIGIALTLVTLPGIWLALLSAVAIQAWLPGTFSWWTLGICAALALSGELLEFAASAAGAAKGGASKKGALGAIAGSLLGAIVGSFFIPPIGTIIGAVLGAGAAVVWVEMALNSRSMSAAAKAGTGAAAGRLLATILKTGIAIIVAAMLITGARLT